MRKEVDLIKIEVLSSGELVAQPETNDNGTFEYIYRAAAGVYWDKARQGFITPCLKELSYYDWFQRTPSAAASELGVNLKVTNRTRFINVSEGLKSQIVAFEDANARLESKFKH
jgi:hypothetical protein